MKLKNQKNKSWTFNEGTNKNREIIIIFMPGKPIIKIKLLIEKRDH